MASTGRTMRVTRLTVVDLAGSIDHVNDVQLVQRSLHEGSVGCSTGASGVVAVGERQIKGVQDGVDEVELDLSQGVEDPTEEGNLGAEEGAEA